MTQSTAQIRFDDGAGSHAPDLYRYDEIAKGVKHLSDIGEEQADQFRQTGFLVVEEALTGDQVAAAKQAITDLIDEKGKTTYQLMFEGAVKDRIDSLTRQERHDAIRKVFHFGGADERLDTLTELPDLIAAMNTLGMAQPMMFQTMALLKGPQGREKPWHQDHAYFNYPLDALVVGVWIAIDEATTENGCMHIIPQQLEPRIHFKRRDWQICDTDIQSLSSKRIAVPLKPGGMLLFSSKLVHGTPTNHSAKRRQALQYHYREQDGGEVTTEQRMEIFGAEGKDVEC